MIFLSTIFLLVTQFHPVQAETFYVAQTPNASDDNSGTSRLPLRTIYSAIQKARPGDFVIVRDGDYSQDDVGWGTGVVPVLNSGLVAQPIRILAAKDSQPIVAKFLIQNVKHVRLFGFSVQGLDFSEIPAWVDMPNIAKSPVSGPRPDFTEPWESRAARIRQEYATYFALQERLDFESGVDLENCENVEVIGLRIRGFWSGVQSRGCKSLKINFNQISHCVNGVYSWRPRPALQDSEIRGNVITQCLDNGIDLREAAQNVVVVDNSLAYNGISHISLLGGTRDIYVAGNFCAYGGYYSETMEFPGSSAISVHSSGSGIVLYNNTVSYQVDTTGIDGNGIAIDRMRPGSSVLVQSNMMYRVMGDGLTTTESPNNTIRGNMFFEAGFNATAYRRGGGIKFARDSDIGNTVRNNVFAFNRAGGILGEGTVGLQAAINHNEYYLNDEPIMWDAYDESAGTFFRLTDLRLLTGWENSGMAYGPLAW